MQTETPTEAEPTKVPRARLNHLASRKLAALGLATQAGSDGETLEGAWVFQLPLVHPIREVPIPGARFQVVGHDRVCFTEAPLAALGPITFFDVETRMVVEQRVNAALQRRWGVLEKMRERMRALKLEVGFEPDRLLIRGLLTAPRHTFELLGGAEGVRVWRVTPNGKKPFELPRQVALLSLEAYAAAADLEAQLVRAAPRWEQTYGSPDPKDAPLALPMVSAGNLTVAPVPAAGESLSIALLKRFGEGASVKSNCARLEVSQEFYLDGTRYTFSALHQGGTSFEGRLTGPGGDRWAERFDVTRFPGIENFVATELHVSAKTAAAPPVSLTPPLAQAPTAPPAAAVSSIPDHLRPRPGEVWLMSVLIEEERDGEVRYVCMDTDGKPYGATRLLKRPDFDSVFAQERGGYCLRIHIDSVLGEVAGYHQLDPARQPRGTPKSLALAILVSTFVPESAAY